MALSSVNNTNQIAYQQMNPVLKTKSATSSKAGIKTNHAAEASDTNPSALKKTGFDAKI
ncbi:Hypothetical protein LUCI_4402 [Lucifera butyrica]|uniref:Uncharacterized protein n=1 Tax=Lucifera butyrica TaxID=1351585 RepID=A0A498R8T4_9FIRM|nr:hypothetical protein [Lucifera butyrica]VBB09116.1 Hypothetical protein LUCI_4402 [Lucifera butyrica]